MASQRTRPPCSIPRPRAADPAPPRRIAPEPESGMASNGRGFRTVSAGGRNVTEMAEAASPQAATDASLRDLPSPGALEPSVPAPPAVRPDPFARRSPDGGRVAGSAARGQAPPCGRAPRGSSTARSRPLDTGDRHAPTAFAPPLGPAVFESLPAHRRRLRADARRAVRHAHGLPRSGRDPGRRWMRPPGRWRPPRRRANLAAPAARLWTEADDDAAEGVHPMRKDDPARLSGRASGLADLFRRLRAGPSNAG